jgi:hypothetical protein
VRPGCGASHGNEKGFSPGAPAPALKIESNLKVAVAKVDITPPAGTKVVGHVREVDGVRDRLHAAALLFDDGKTKAAIVTLDPLNVPAHASGRAPR